VPDCPAPEGVTHTLTTVGGSSRRPSIKLDFRQLVDIETDLSSEEMATKCGPKDHPPNILYRWSLQPAWEWRTYPTSVRCRARPEKLGSIPISCSPENNTRTGRSDSSPGQTRGESDIDRARLPILAFEVYSRRSIPLLPGRQPAPLTQATINMMSWCELGSLQLPG
jgi:hypothetical protein